jgi:hypothetical protein
MKNFLISGGIAALVTGVWAVADYFLDKYLGVPGGNYPNISVASFISASMSITIFGIFNKKARKHGV